MKIFWFIAAISMIFANTASAQCRNVKRGAVFSSCVAVAEVTRTVVETPVVVTTVAVPVPVPVPVLVPAFQFQYTPPCAVPVQAGYTGQPGIIPGYNQHYMQQGYAPPQGYAPQTMQTTPFVNNQDKIRELAKVLLEEMQKQNTGDDGPPSVKGVSSINNTGIPPGLPIAPIMSPEQAAPIAIAALQQNCSHCHTGPASKGDFVMFAQPGLFNQNIPWRSIVREIDAGRMPKPDSQWRLTGNQAAAIRDWLRGI